MLTTNPNTQSVCAQVISHATNTNQHKLLSASPSKHTQPKTHSKVTADRYISVIKISCHLLETPTSVVLHLLRAYVIVSRRKATAICGKPFPYCHR
jgi:hypothetical protein